MIYMKLEVAKKQSYIFASEKLLENALASARIAHVTSSDYFQTIAPELYQKNENLVYSGGGHTILQFETKEKATAFAKVITAHTMLTYPGLALFCVQITYDSDNKTPKENLKALSSALEHKKSIRQSGFRLTGIGIEALSENNYKPSPMAKTSKTDVPAPLENEFPFVRDFADLTMKKEDIGTLSNHFIAVVHIDGNAMSKRIDNVYFETDNQGNPDPKKQIPLEKIPETLQNFSNGIQENFEEAFRSMVKAFLNLYPQYENSQIPIRPVILAGDDVCFVCAGCIALELSRLFMEALATCKNPQDGKAYSSCAGIAVGR